MTVDTCFACGDYWPETDYGLDLIYPAHGDSSADVELCWIPCCLTAQDAVERDGWAAFYGRSLAEVLWDRLGYRLDAVNARGLA